MIDPELRLRAVLLWPDDHYLQVEWLRAVRVVRATQRGWLIESPPLLADDETAPDNVVHLRERRP